MIKIAFNQRSIKNYQTYIEESRDFESDVKDGHQRLHGHKIRVRQVDAGSDLSSQSSQIQSSPNPPPEPPRGLKGKCFGCDQEGHFRRDCPLKNQMPPPRAQSQQQPPQLPTRPQSAAPPPARGPTKGGCELHPQSSHNNRQCLQQQKDPCRLHPGAAHGNQICRAQNPQGFQGTPGQPRQQPFQPCELHPNSNHSQQSCRAQRPGGPPFQQPPHLRYLQPQPAQFPSPYQQPYAMAMPYGYPQIPQGQPQAPRPLAVQQLTADPSSLATFPEGSLPPASG